jgi:hypothetical protein
MKASTFSLGLVMTLLAAPALQAQELSPRMGFAAFFTQPTDSGGRLYGPGWKVNLTVHVHREAQVEGRVRLEFGEFNQGGEVADSPYSGARYRAQTRLVGYDWLIPLGQKRETGLDLILGMGGAHWFRERTAYSLAGNPYPYRYTDWDNELAFAGTVGLRFRLNRQVELELHQVFTSVPGNQKDFKDAELSHTALGVGLRF